MSISCLRLKSVMGGNVLGSGVGGVCEGCRLELEVVVGWYGEGGVGVFIGGRYVVVVLGREGGVGECD